MLTEHREEMPILFEEHFVENETKPDFFSLVIIYCTYTCFSTADGGSDQRPKENDLEFELSLH